MGWRFMGDSGCYVVARNSRSGFQATATSAHVWTEQFGRKCSESQTDIRFPWSWRRWQGRKAMEWEIMGCWRGMVVKETQKTRISWCDVMKIPKREWERQTRMIYEWAYDNAVTVMTNDARSEKQLKPVHYRAIYNNNRFLGLNPAGRTLLLKGTHF